MSSNKNSREEQFLEKFGWADEQDSNVQAFHEQMAERVIRQDDELIWACYRFFDVSQAEAAARADPDVETSQSTVSRVCRDLDDDILTGERTQLSGNEEPEDLKMHSEEWLEAYRDVLASAIVNLQALRLISSPETSTPVWAAEMYPELLGEATRVGHAMGLAEDKIVKEEPPAKTDSVSTAAESDD